MALRVELPRARVTKVIFGCTASADTGPWTAKRRNHGTGEREDSTGLGEHQPRGGPDLREFWHRLSLRWRTVACRSANTDPASPTAAPAELVQAAFAAVRQWKHRPTLLDGVPFAVEMRVT